MKTEEKTGKSAAKTGRSAVETGAMRDKTVMKMAYAKGPKMVVQDAVQILKAKVIIGEPEAKTVSASDRLTGLDLSKATTKATETTVVIVVEITK